MSGCFVAVVIFAVLIALLWVFADLNYSNEEAKKYAGLSAEERDVAREQGAIEKEWGPLNPAMICPHCQTKGKVRTKLITQKQGVSGGKATAALLTGGISLVAVGLSKKGQVTQAHCDNCNNDWMF